MVLTAKLVTAQVEFKRGDSVRWADELTDSQALRARDVVGDGPFQVYGVTHTEMLDVQWTSLVLSSDGQPLLHVHQFHPISFDPSWLQLISPQV